MGRAAGLHADIHKLIGSQALSKLGDNFTEVALALFVLKITQHSVAALGVVLAMVSAPRVALGWMVAGFIDRLPKRVALVAADLARAVLVASIPVVASYGWTIAVVFLIYAFAMVYQPILRAVQPQISGSPEVNARSAARQQTYYAAADIGAYLAAGGIIFLVGLAPAFWLDALTYLGSALLIVSIRVGPEVWKHVGGKASGFWQDIAEGFRFMQKNGVVMGLTLVSAGTFLAVGAINTLLAPLSRSLWHVSSAHYVWLLLAIALGSLVSGVIIEHGRLAERLSSRVLVTAGFVLTGVGLGAVDLARTWIVGLVCLFVAGLGNALYGSFLIAWMQRVTPTAVRARVLALRGVGNGLGGVLGAFLTGMVASALGLIWAVAATFALWCILAVSVLAMGSFKSAGTEKSIAM